MLVFICHAVLQSSAAGCRAGGTVSSLRLRSLMSCENYSSVRTGLQKMFVYWQYFILMIQWQLKQQDWALIATVTPLNNPVWLLELDISCLLSFKAQTYEELKASVAGKKIELFKRTKHCSDYLKIF